MKLNRLFSALTATLLVATSAYAGSGGPLVEATLEPNEISAGEAALLEVTVTSNHRAEGVSVPEVDGIEYTGLGQSSTMQMVNGRVFGSTTYRIRVTAAHPGTFVLPGIEAHAGGRTASSEPLELKVTARAAPRSAGTSRQHAAAGKAGDPAFLTVTPEKSELYVGERIPVEVRAYFSSGRRATIRSLPRLEGGAFTLDTPEGKPRQTEELVEGEPYTVLIWEGAISAVKEGEHAFDASMDVTVVMPRDRSRKRPGAGRFADDPFFDSFFDGFFDHGREREVTLRCEPLSLRAKPLPAAGRPATFSGAVGAFSLDATATPTKVAAGDPITLTMRVSGRGNFARVSAPHAAPDHGWKRYPAKGEFEAHDALGLEGVKRFDQAVVPRGGDVAAIPPVEFSYFDPAREEFVTLTTETIPVEVSGAPAPDAAYEEVIAPPAPAQRTDAGATRRSLRPVWTRGWFRAFGLGLLLAFAAALFLTRRRDPRGRPASLRAVRSATGRAIGQSDAPAFFAQCRAAVQERLAPARGCSPGAITRAEIQEGTDLSDLFGTADAVAYSGHAVSQDEMRNWQTRLLDEIGRLEKVQ